MEILKKNHIYQGHVLDILKTFPDGSVNMIITSPPYWGLRDYHTDPQIWDGDKNCEHEWNMITTNVNQGNDELKIKRSGGYKTEKTQGFCQKCGAWKGSYGNEPNPDLYIKHTVQIFKEIHRVLKKNGTCWLNIGDSYNGSGGDHKKDGKNDAGFQGKLFRGVQPKNVNLLKPKDLCLIPFKLALALQQPYFLCKGCGKVDHLSNWGKFPNGRLICPNCEKSKENKIGENGWWIRQDIIWQKNNCLPESVVDRCTNNYEHIFLMAKNKKYYYDADAIKEPYQNLEKSQIFTKNNKDKDDSGRIYETEDKGGRNKRSVWSINVKPFSEAHFAVFPEKLIEIPIKAGCPKGGIVLDPFFGSGTTGVVALNLDRNYVGIELNSDYIKIAKKRLREPHGAKKVRKSANRWFGE